VAWAVTAEWTGIASGGHAFGWEQKAGVAVGMTVSWFAALVLVGWSPRRSRRAAPKQAEPAEPATSVSA
jgi:hypothetical protein